MKTARNVGIIAALAAVIVFVPGGGTGEAVTLQALSIVFLVTIGWFAIRSYREYRVSLYSLGERNRAILYGSVGLAVLVVAATSRLWTTGAGIAVWFALVALASAGVARVVRAAREHW